MKPQVKDLLGVLDGLAPTALAEKWDNVGLLVGNPHNRVTTILVGLDATNTLVDEAIARKADTIITHHPVIFKPLSAIDTSDPAGRILQKALAHDISIIGCHTNLDSAVDGVNDILATMLGLTKLVPLQPVEYDGHVDCGLGRVGSYDTPLEKREFLRRLFAVLKLESFNMAGELPEVISRVALCGGSGSDFAKAAYASGADVYLTAEIKHATAVWANEVGFTIIDGTHFSTEQPGTDHLAEKLKEITAENNWQTNIYLTDTELHPFTVVSAIHDSDNI